MGRPRSRTGRAFATMEPMTPLGPGRHTFDLLVDLDESTRRAFVARLTAKNLVAGELLFRQGESASQFGFVQSGTFEVVRSEGGRTRPLATVGEGSILGEMGVLRQGAREADVICRTPGEVMLGDRDVLVNLLDQPGVVERLQRLITTRLAEDTNPVLVRTRNAEFALLPLLERDREAFVAGLRALSDESLYRRFFTGGQPSASMVDRLLALDYIDHFAWVVATPDASEGVAVARYHRDREARQRAEAAFAVADGQQGKGIGTMMLGALAVAARAAGIAQLRAEVLSDNHAMRAVLNKAGAEWAPVEPGVVETVLDVETCTQLLDVGTIDRLDDAASRMFAAASLALTHTLEDD